jgi:regulator of replication initiation timing
MPWQDYECDVTNIAEMHDCSKPSCPISRGCARAVPPYTGAPMTAPLPEMSDERIDALILQYVELDEIGISSLVAFRKGFARAILSEGTASLKAENERLRARIDALRAIVDDREVERNAILADNARLKAEHATLRAELTDANLRFTAAYEQVAKTLAERDSLKREIVYLRNMHATAVYEEMTAKRDAQRWRKACEDKYIPQNWQNEIDAALSTAPGKEQA